MNSLTLLGCGDVCKLISKVLVAIDGSDCAIRALDLALDVAEKYSATLSIVNVVELPFYHSLDDPPIVTEGMTTVVNDLRKVHENLLSKAAERAALLKPNIQVSKELLEGHPADQIVATANEGNFSLVVLGHGGKGRFKEIFLGGTSEKVAHLVRCNVLIVK
jgi:nucleotide-binding universal stress UspA family protein